MPVPSERKRIEIPADLHAELEKDARRLHVTPTALATMLVSEGLERHRALAAIPLHERTAPRSAPAVSATDNGREG